jgi:hypothetical protein
MVIHVRQHIPVLTNNVYTHHVQQHVRQVINVHMVSHINHHARIPTSCLIFILAVHSTLAPMSGFVGHSYFYERVRT